jgi:hypothetical protein
MACSPAGSSAEANPLDSAVNPIPAAADARGLYRDAAQLHKNAAASGDFRAAFYLINPPAFLRADPRPAHWAAAHATLTGPGGVASLLEWLREAGAHEQAAALLARDPAAHATLDSRDDVASLLNSLRKAGADDQAAALVERLPAAGMFYLFRDQEDHRNRFRFGRETDGRPAEPWGWEDLDLWLVPLPQTCGTGAALSRGRS